VRSWTSPRATTGNASQRCSSLKRHFHQSDRIDDEHDYFQCLVFRLIRLARDGIWLAILLHRSNTASHEP